MRYLLMLSFAFIAACDQLTGTAPLAKAACAGPTRADTVAQHYFVTTAGDTVLVGPADAPAGGWWQTVIVEAPCVGR